MPQHRANLNGFGKRPVLGFEEKRPASFIQKLSSAFDFTQPLKSEEIMIFTARLGAVPALSHLLTFAVGALFFLMHVPAWRALPPDLASGNVLAIFILGPVVIVALLFLWIRQSAWAAWALFATSAIPVFGHWGGKLELLIKAAVLLALSVVALRGALSLSRARRGPIE